MKYCPLLTIKGRQKLNFKKKGENLIMDVNINGKQIFICKRIGGVYGI